MPNSLLNKLKLFAAVCLQAYIFSLWCFKHNAYKCLFLKKPSILKKQLLLCLVFITTHCYAQNAAYWQQQVDVDIHAALNDTAHSLDGNIKMRYSNHSPDTLHFIWIHLWPNAYKNDRTALSDELLQNGRTDFYFSKEEDRGYINRLNFEVDGDIAMVKDHPQQQDIVQLFLPKPLPPGSSTSIQTDFRIKIPKLFSRSGHLGQSYQFTQWFPKPAVYDRKGWHPMPYLDQGEFYSEWGNYRVSLSLPAEYKVAATGVLKSKTLHGSQQTLQFEQDSVHDFAWFADKNYKVLHDTVQIASRVIDLYAYHFPGSKAQWSKAIGFMKDALHSKSNWVGTYPYSIVSVVESADTTGSLSGMEYPTVCIVSPDKNEAGLDFLINHEIGHNWFQGLLASNERLHPWMDEAMNSYYDKRYGLLKYNGNPIPIFPSKSQFIHKRMPQDFTATLLNSAIAIKKDQPIDIPAQNFSSLNYALIPYEKAAQWMQVLEQELGTSLLDSVMRHYFAQWKFKHPYPEDFLQVAQTVSGRDLSGIFALLSKKGALKPMPKKKIAFTGFFNLKNTDSLHYISAAPIAGFNFYDKLMLGGLIHNYNLPRSPFEFFVAPMYALGSQKLTGLAALSYQFYSGSNGQRIKVGLSAAHFTVDRFIDSTGKKNYQPYSKWVPTVKWELPSKNPRSTLSRYLQWKTFFINETGLLFSRDTINQIDVISYPRKKSYINQLELVAENNRALYPYKAVWNTALGKGFIRTDVTLNYFFNYATGGGMQVRMFAGKFFYTGSKTLLTQFETDRYHLNMTGPKGYEDYTYQNYFYGRNEFDGGASQQIMIRDGAFKVRTDLLSSKIGKTDDWLGAINLSTTIPHKINPLSVLPIKLPIKLFADIGSYANAWDDNHAGTPKLLYDAGLQLSLLNNTVNIYVPLLYSKVYSDYFKSTLGPKRFWKTISFSIDVQNISLKKLLPLAPL